VSGPWSIHNAMPHAVPRLGVCVHTALRLRCEPRGASERRARSAIAEMPTASSHADGSAESILWPAMLRALMRGASSRAESLGRDLGWRRKDYRSEQEQQQQACGRTRERSHGAARGGHAIAPPPQALHGGTAALDPSGATKSSQGVARGSLRGRAAADPAAAGAPACTRPVRHRPPQCKATQGATKRIARCLRRPGSSSVPQTVAEATATVALPAAAMARIQKVSSGKALGEELDDCSGTEHVEPIAARAPLTPHVAV
jgi:hypothetical protein